MYNPEVPLLGEAEPLRFSAEEAARMWMDSQPFSEEADLDTPAKQHIRRSEDEDWVIRMQLAPFSCLYENRLRDIVTRDYNYLACLGLNILNFASVSDGNNTKLFTITPWIDDIQLCTYDEYHSIVPILRTYEETTRHLGVRVSPWELMAPGQYSRIETTNQIFLHDVDPNTV